MSDQMLAVPLAMLGSSYEQPVPIFQQLSGGHPSGGDDVREIPIVAAQRRRSPGRARDRHQPRDRPVLVEPVWPNVRRRDPQETRRAHARLHPVALMEWMPPPDGIAMCQGGDVCRIPRNGEGIHGNCYHYWSRPCKAVLSGARRSSGWKLSLSKEAHARESPRLSCRAATLRRRHGGLRERPSLG